MPTISEFYGITIAMFYDDHNPPHFHAYYQGHRAAFTIEDLRLLQGKLPRRAMTLVLEWAFKHRKELKKEWGLAREKKPLFKVKPLD